MAVRLVEGAGNSVSDSVDDGVLEKVGRVYNPALTHFDLCSIT